MNKQATKRLGAMCRSDKEDILVREIRHLTETLDVLRQAARRIETALHSIELNMIIGDFRHTDSKATLSVHEQRRSTTTQET